MKQSTKVQTPEERRRIRAATRIFKAWLKTPRGQRFANAKNPGWPRVNLDTGRVTVRRKARA